MSAPRSVQLPSGLIIELVPTTALRPPTPRNGPRNGEPLFSELSRMVEEEKLELRAGRRRGTPLLQELELRDFHALRAIATRLGWLAETSVEVVCRNCGAPMTCAPCRSLPLGPFVDRELGASDLDKTLDLSTPHDVPEIRVRKRSGIDRAREVTLAPRTLRETLPLHRALGATTRERGLDLTAAVVNAMGVVALGEERDPRRLADALSSCSSLAFGTITDLYLDAHYPPRLFSPHACPKCGARNDVDAPYEREFDRTNVADTSSGQSRFSARSNQETFPSFERFDARAVAIADEIFGDDAAGIRFIVEGGVPACDEGGEPLLGSYVPAFEGDMHMPSRPPEITVFYRAFRAEWDEAGPYDWDGELRETIEHELEHHQAYLAGDDPVDRAERVEIDDEARLVLGRKGVLRSGVRGLGSDLGGFIARTWPIWLILVLVSLVLLIFGR